MGTLTNTHGIHEAIVRAVTFDPYTPGDGRLTVSQLVAPVQQVALKRRHADDIVEDVSQRFWALFGSTNHAMLERANTNQLTELRLGMDVPLPLSCCEVDHVRVTGQFDAWDMDGTRTLTDFKVTSVYAIKDGIKPEWEAQLNCYAELVRQHGGEVAGLEIVALLRDHHAAQAKRDADYPSIPCATLPVRLWPPEVARAYLETRAELHMRAQASEAPLPPCSADERWETPTRWAHMRAGRKSAVKLYGLSKYQDLAAAKNAARQAVGADSKPGAFVEYRPGTARRCAEYCPVAPWCAQRQAELANAPSVQADLHG